MLSLSTSITTQRLSAADCRRAGVQGPGGARGDSCMVSMGQCTIPLDLIVTCCKLKQRVLAAASQMVLLQHKQRHHLVSPCACAIHPAVTCICWHGCPHERIPVIDRRLQ